MENEIEGTRKVNPILQVLLQGVQDDQIPLSLLRGIPEIVQKIWNLVTDYWKNQIIVSNEHDMSYTRLTGQFNLFKHFSEDEFQTRFQVKFPKPKDININMMPFKISYHFENTQLPDYLREYHEKILRKCTMCIPTEEWGKIGYLTIQENYVDANTSQRRTGLHMDSPGSCINDKTNGAEVMNWGRGCGRYMLQLRGGIYVVSNVENSCAVWGCHIKRPENVEPDVSGELGDLEHLREFLPDEKLIENNALYWFTDRTPHESLPLKKGQYRQFFRLVTSELSLWHEDHCTKNPLGVVPDPKITRIVKGSKFENVTEDRTGNVCVDYDMLNLNQEQKSTLKKQN